jgi:hypothetical protein
MKQRTTEWLEDVNKDYHDKQFLEPYRSTVAFCDWIEEQGLINSKSEFKLVDIATGQGANMAYMSQRYPKCSFVGLELNQQLVDSGNQYFKNNDIRNCIIVQGDMYKMDSELLSGAHAVTSFQTLSWLPEATGAIKALSSLNSEWIALTSLFYDGPLSCNVEVNDYDDNLNINKQSCYNVYSIPVIKKYFLENGFDNLNSVPFNIDIDLAQPVSKKRGTYTKMVTDGTRLQFSGPMHLPWHFITVERIDSEGK